MAYLAVALEGLIALKEANAIGLASLLRKVLQIDPKSRSLVPRQLLKKAVSDGLESGSLLKVFGGTGRGRAGHGRRRATGVTPVDRLLRVLLLWAKASCSKNSKRRTTSSRGKPKLVSSTGKRKKKPAAMKLISGLLMKVLRGTTGTPRIRASAGTKSRTSSTAKRTTTKTTTTTTTTTSTASKKKRKAVSSSSRTITVTAAAKARTTARAAPKKNRKLSAGLTVKKQQATKTPRTALQLRKGTTKKKTGATLTTAKRRMAT